MKLYQEISISLAIPKKLVYNEKYKNIMASVIKSGLSKKLKKRYKVKLLDIEITAIESI